MTVSVIGYSPSSSTDSGWKGYQFSGDEVAHHPERCPLARQNGKLELEVREFHFGKRPHVFRVTFTVDGASVRILRIRRAQRRALTGRQLQRAWEEDDQKELDQEE